MSLWQNLVTLGASGRIQDKVGAYEKRRQELLNLLAKVGAERELTQSSLQRVVEQKTFGLLALKRVSQLCAQLRARDRILASEGESLANHAVDLERVLNALQKAPSFGVLDIASNAIKGGVSGVATAMGAWALVGYIGTASTGTAISTLTGVAAGDATLAFLGGGALAAGGGGIAAGTAVLGGIVAVPALIIFGLVNHAKANLEIERISRQEAELVRDIAECHGCLVAFATLRARSCEMCDALALVTKALSTEQDRAAAFLRRYSLLGGGFRWFRRLLTGNRFSKPEVEKVSNVVRVAAELAKLLDQPLLDKDGRPL